MRKCKCGCGKEFEPPSNNPTKLFLNRSHYLAYSKRINSFSLQKDSKSAYEAERDRKAELFYNWK